MSFADLGLAPELLRAVAQQGYTEPTPVQAEAIPLVLAGRDLLAGAQTGTGKTAAFVLPMLQRLHASRPRGPSRDPRPRSSPRPVSSRSRSRRASASTAHEQPIQSVAIYGGVGFDPQVRALRNGPEIVVATPGRLLDHVGQRTIDLSRVEILVLDEADRMLDMGFIRDIRKILALLPAQAPEPAVLGHVLRRDPPARRRHPARPGLGPGHAAQHARPSSSSRSSTRSTASASASCSATSSRPASSTRRSSSPAPSTAPTGSPSSSSMDGIPPPRSTATRASRSACARSTTSRRTGRDPRRDRGRGARPRHRLAAARRQLRAADGPRGLRPPHRPHRPGRRRRRRHLAGLRRRDADAPRDRSRPRPADPAPRSSRASSPTRRSARSRSFAVVSAAHDPVRASGARPAARLATTASARTPAARDRPVRLATTGRVPRPRPPSTPVRDPRTGLRDRTRASRARWAVRRDPHGSPAPMAPRVMKAPHASTTAPRRGPTAVRHARATATPARRSPASGSVSGRPTARGARAAVPATAAVRATASSTATARHRDRPAPARDSPDRVRRCSPVSA